MLEILALCSCACITTCIWCAVAALTCPRIVNGASSPSPRSEDPGICQTICPFKLCVKNWGESAENHETYPQLFCPDVPYPILMFPVEYPQRYDQTSSSTSVPTSSGSNSRYRVKNSEEGETLEQIQNDRESSSQCSMDSGLDFIVCSNHPPKPPPRLRRNRLKSILRSKFKKREEDEVEKASIVHCVQSQTVKNDSDQVSETEFPPMNVRCKSTCCRSRLEPVLNSVPLFKMVCKTCRLEKQICKCSRHPILRSQTEYEIKFEYPMRFCRLVGSSHDSNSNVPDKKCAQQKKSFSSGLITTSSMDSSDQTVFLCDQSTCVCEDEDRGGSSIFRRRSKLRGISRK